MQIAEWEAEKKEAGISISAVITVRTNDDAVSHEIAIWCDAQEVEIILSGFGETVEKMTRRIVAQYVPVSTTDSR